MRGDIVHQIYGLHTGRAEDAYFGTYRTEAEATAAIARLRETHGSEWVEKYHSRGFAIRPATVETDFQIPTLPKPRDHYVAIGTAKSNQPGTWDSTVVRVSRRGAAPGELTPVCEFERDYALLHTFEPFRQGGRDYALVSRTYTKTAVLDLASGQIVAEETESSPGAGFCPVGFYVPDWWDIYDDSIIPGSLYWKRDQEWSSASFGFVWGCHWGDDSSWKVQYLDLSGIADGVIKRDERFGYIKLATAGYLPPSLDPAWIPAAKPSAPPPFISINRYQGLSQVKFSVEMDFDVSTGACRDLPDTSEQPA